TFYSPRADDIEHLIRPNTRLIYAETPGSLTMELQDIQALAETAKRYDNILVACDNTWASGYCFQPLSYGADLSIIAGTKYLGGHSDLTLGAVTASKRIYQRLHDAVTTLGLSVSSDDGALALRGMRTLHLRYPAHAQRATQVAQWLERQPEVRSVLYPALKSSPDYHQWHTQFTGA